MISLRNCLFFVLLLGLFSCAEDDLFGTKSKEAYAIVQLGGTIIEDDIDSSSVRMPEVSLGDTARLTFTIINKGEGVLNIGNITIDHELFDIIQPEAKPLATDQQASFTVLFSPNRFGERLAHVGFYTNDAQNPAFAFQIIGSSIKELSIAYLDTQTPDGLNTADDGIGTRFVSSLELFDPFDEVQDNTELIIHAVFSNGIQASLTKTGTGGSGFQVNNSKTIIRYSFSAIFAESTHIDVEVYLRLASGKETRRVTYRISRPSGAN